MLRRVAYDFWGSIVQIPELSYGLWRISRLHNKSITVFGGTNMPNDSYYYAKTKELGFYIAKEGFSLITGGGSGIMEAALCGALEASDWYHALGIGVKGVDVSYIPRCKQATIYVNNFNIRKLLLVHYSSGIVICPGGFGTLDELFHTLNLIKTYQIPSIPVILFGSEFWKPLVEWIFETPYHRKLILDCGIKIFTVVDSTDEVLKILMEHCPSV